MSLLDLSIIVVNLPHQHQPNSSHIENTSIDLPDFLRCQISAFVDLFFNLDKLGIDVDGIGEKFGQGLWSTLLALPTPEV